MSNEKIIYLTIWKDQEKYPDFEPILIEILNKLEKGKIELETTKKQLNDSMNFHCPNFTTTRNGYVACDLDKHKILIDLAITKKLLDEANRLINMDIPVWRDVRDIWNKQYEEMRLR